MDIDGMIVGKDIKITLPPNTKITDLKAFFTILLLPSVAINGVKQESGITSNDFSKPVVYRITTEDGTSNDYTVTITVTKLNEKTITWSRFSSGYSYVVLVNTKKSDNSYFPDLELFLATAISNNPISFMKGDQFDVYYK